MDGVALLINDDSFAFYSVAAATISHFFPFTAEEWTFSHGRLPVSHTSDDLYGYFDLGGHLCIPCKFPEASPFDAHGAIVRCAEDELNYRRIDRAGELTGQPYASLRRFHPQGCMTGGRLARGDRHMVLVDASGDVVGKHSYLEVWQEHENLIPVRFSETQIGWIDKQGTEVRRFHGSGIGNHFESGLVPVESDKGKWGLMNVDTEWVVAPTFDFVESVGPSRFLLGNEHNDRREVRLADACGHWLGQSTFSWIDYFIDGYAMVFRDTEDEVSEYNFVSMSGELAAPAWI
ncbi:MAG: WG repeat-containing protein [Planctomycetales bacterium]|nr:WG repeat-containing protein [Planctomycetales bacterium]MCA9166382.1 WG repeat-containing protein [Planctomycetales bacterium]